MREIKTEKFSGPLGLLLSMIEKEEMDITEINLASIADDYVNYVKGVIDIDPEELSDFLLVAAKLLYIKSKALLPYLLLDDEEEDGYDLEKQLRMYQEYANASQKIKDIIALGNFMYVPEDNKPRKLKTEEAKFVAPKQVDKNILQTVMASLLDRLEKEREEVMEEEDLPPKMNIEEKIYYIRDMLVKNIKVNFSKLLQETKDKTELIVSFLAVLELAKQKELSFSQDQLFSEIHILSQNQEEL